jgi:hypothetical protein
VAVARDPGAACRFETLEAEVRRITDAIAVIGHSDSLLRARADSLESKLTEVRHFVTERLTEIHAPLSEDPVRGKNEFVKHVEAVTVQPEALVRIVTTLRKATGTCWVGGRGALGWLPGDATPRMHSRCRSG